jgi:hypothetical protein
MKMLRLLTLPAIASLLAACSPHPGSGNWQSTVEITPQFIQQFIRLEVGYDGRTDIFGDKAVKQSSTDTSNGAIRRCFWRGMDAQTIVMNCVQAANTDIEESYQLRVSADNEMAELIKDEVVVGRFVREKRAAK